MPQQERAHATREVIVRAAAVEFDRAGFGATSLSRILRRGGLTKGAFYFHFQSKEAVAAAVVARQSAAWPDLVARWQHRDLDPLRTMIGLLDDAIRTIAEDPVVRAGLRLAVESDGVDVPAERPYLGWERAVAARLTDAARAGLLRDGTDPAATARVLVSALTGSRVVSALSTDSADLAARAREVFQLVLAAVADPHWLRGWSGPDELIPASA